MPLLFAQKRHFVSPAELNDPTAHVKQALNPGLALNVPALHKTHLSVLLIVAL